MSDVNFRDWLNANDEPNDLCPPALPTQLAYQFLIDYLLPEGWYTCAIGSDEQINTEIVHRILMDHSPKYRKQVKEERTAYEREEYLASNPNSVVSRMIKFLNRSKERNKKWK